ncbi:MAG TPA: hypothetical protein VFA10_13620 [Ktedonobacteraceae bacterium]|jgi:hypothetical protein|nr:hypothetical protein [Ktedonobacteraceae bacterium]
MASPYSTHLIRLGLWTFPGAGLLKLAGQFGTLVVWILAMFV